MNPVILIISIILGLLSILLFIGTSRHFMIKRRFKVLAKLFYADNKDRIANTNNLGGKSEKDFINNVCINSTLMINKEIVKFYPAMSKIDLIEYRKMFKELSEAHNKAFSFLYTEDEKNNTS